VTLLFLHAFPFDARMWERQLGLVPDAEAPSLYDLGETMDDCAAALLERYDGELLLVGASMGGYLAYDVARLAPERVRGLLTEGARAQADAPGGRARRDELIRLTREEGLEALWRAMRPTAFSAGVDEELLARGRDWVLAQDPEDVVRALAAMRDRRDHTDILKLLDPHPRIVLGDLDRIARPGDFEGVVLPEAVTIVRGAGHLPSLEQPDAFDGILEEALAAWTR
jgi:pimeloyl-ACP methyl ester carboxylesterase